MRQFLADGLRQQPAVFGRRSRLERRFLVLFAVPPARGGDVVRAAFVAGDQIDDLAEASDAGVPIDEADRRGLREMLGEDPAEQAVGPLGLLAGIEQAIGMMILALQHLVLEMPAMLIQVALVGAIGSQTAARIAWVD